MCRVHRTSRPSGLDSTWVGLISGGIFENITTIRSRETNSYLKCVDKTLLGMWMEALWTTAVVSKPNVMTCT